MIFFIFGQNQDDGAKHHHHQCIPPKHHHQQQQQQQQQQHDNEKHDKESTSKEVRRNCHCDVCTKNTSKIRNQGFKNVIYFHAIRLFTNQQELMTLEMEI